MPSQAVIKHHLSSTMAKTVWAVWGAFDDVMAAFQALSNALTVDAVDEVMHILECYATIVYDRERY